MNSQWNRVIGNIRLGLFIALILQLMPSAVSAEENNRYQAIVLHEGGRSGQSGSFMPKVFIIDSRDGHIWTWEQKTQIQDLKGSFSLGSVLTYQGKVRPAQKMGEIVDQATVR